MTGPPVVHCKGPYFYVGGATPDASMSPISCCSCMRKASHSSLDSSRETYTHVPGGPYWAHTVQGNIYTVPAPSSQLHRPKTIVTGCGAITSNTINASRLYSPCPAYTSTSTTEVRTHTSLSAGSYLTEIMSVHSHYIVGLGIPVLPIETARTYAPGISMGTVAVFPAFSTPSPAAAPRSRRRRGRPRRPRRQRSN